MDDRSEGSRRTRPESSASGNSRVAPSSNNSSSAHLPRSQTANSLQSRSGASGASLLHERLRERKVESARASRRRSVDVENNGFQSSPVKTRDDRRPSSSGMGSGKNMGVKQHEEQVSTLHKQNFDLKLELYHRRQRQEALEIRLEAAEKKMAEQQELQEINDQLLAELEKRDHAVEEAVSIIVNLEEKIEQLKRDREHVRAFESQYDREGYYTCTEDGPPSSPPEYEREKIPNARILARMPSFLSDTTTEGIDNLRSLYVPVHKHSDVGLSKLAEEERLPDSMDSPRLSVLSESSFLSVYPDKQKFLLDPPDDEPRVHRSPSSVEKWVEGRPRVVTPPAKITPPNLRKSQFLSINDVLESPLQRLEKLRHTLEKSSHSLVSDRVHHEHSRTINETQKPRETRRTFGKESSFDNALPPTPDTVGTNTLRLCQQSSDTLAQDHARQAQENARDATKSFYKSTATFHAPGQYRSSSSIRPRSAGETITSRREGHGWDTPSVPSFDDMTDVASVSSTISNRSERYGAKRQTPDLFSFGTGDWGRDVMYDYEGSLPIHSAPQRYEPRRNNVLVDHAPSDDTVAPNCDGSGPQPSPPYGITPIDQSPKPELPDRRSSLAAVTKLRKHNQNSSISSQGTNGSPASKADTKRSRLSNLKLFGRGSESQSTNASPILNDRSSTLRGNRESSSTPRTAAPKYHTTNTTSRTGRGHYVDSSNIASFGGGDGYEVDVPDEKERATPPPIKRSRPPTTTRHEIFRPSSASGFVEHRTQYRPGHVRRQSTEIQPVNTALANAASAGDDEGGKVGSGRKWFGLGRSNSLRRNA